jgi:hypothetical protein
MRWLCKKIKARTFTGFLGFSGRDETVGGDLDLLEGLVSINYTTIVLAICSNKKRGENRSAFHSGGAHIFYSHKGYEPTVECIGHINALRHFHFLFTFSRREEQAYR